LIYGMYDTKDLQIAKRHKGIKYIIWGGSDIDERIKTSMMIVEKIRQLNDIKHFSISNSLGARLDKAKLDHERINFNLADPQIFKPIENFNARAVYIYNGFTPGKEWIYGKEIYEEVMKRLPEFKYILSNKTKVPHEKMPELYSQCFIALRLTKNDGNANTAQELELMNIPLVHNGECTNCIKWSNVDDVELEVRHRNVKMFGESIKNYKNILVVHDNCTDLNYTLDIIKWLSDNNHKVFGIIQTNDVVNKYNNIAHISNQNNVYECIKYFSGNPNLIIFMSPTQRKPYKIFNCPKYFFISNVFANDIIKQYNNIKEKELNKIINVQSIEFCEYVDRIYSNNFNTIQILKKFYKIKSFPLCFNYIPLLPK